MTVDGFRAVLEGWGYRVIGATPTGLTWLIVSRDGDVGSIDNPEYLTEEEREEVLFRFAVRHMLDRSMLRPGH